MNIYVYIKKQIQTQKIILISNADEANSSAKAAACASTSYRSTPLGKHAWAWICGLVKYA